MVDFEATKASFEAALKRLISRRDKNSKHSLLDDWIEAVSPTGISSLSFSFSPRDLYDNYLNDEVVFSKSFYFYDAAYLRECCTPGDDCLAGKRSIPIGGVDGADEFVYVSGNLRLGIAPLHRDDVFEAFRSSGLDKLVEKTASRLETSLTRFVRLLAPETDIVRFSVTRDASRWLLVENLGRKVRYEINLSENWEAGERAFDSLSVSEAFFYSLIEQSCATTDLSILACPPNLQQRIEGILRNKERRKENQKRHSGHGGTKGQKKKGRA
jgi:hypothetical protein